MILALFLFVFASTPSPEASARMEKKIAAIQKNSTRPAGKRGGPVTLTLEEIESFFALSKVPKIPEGLSGIHFELHPDKQVGRAIVDFDMYKAASKRPMNPLVDLFVRGKRAIYVEGLATFPSDGIGQYHLDLAALDARSESRTSTSESAKWFRSR